MLALSYKALDGKTKSKSIAGLRPDAVDERILDFAYNSADLFGYADLSTVAVVKRRYLA